MIRRRPRSSRRIVPTRRSAIAFARGARTGVVTILTSTAVKVDGGEDSIEGDGEPAIAISDEEPEAGIGVVGPMSRLRACWHSQAPVGWAVTPRMCTRRLACSMTKNA
jgi:hypothetical protein